MKHRRLTHKEKSYVTLRIKGQGMREAMRNSLYNTDGLKDTTISDMAKELEAKPPVAAALKRAEVRTLEGATLHREDIIAELENIAMANMGDFVKFQLITVPHGKRGTRQVFAMTPKAFEDLTPEQLACIDEITVDAQGRPKIKLKPSLAAIKELNKLHSWYNAPKAPVDGDGNAVLPAVIPASEYHEARKQMLDEDDC